MFLPLSVCLSVCLFVNRICQKVVGGFSRNLVDRLGVWSRQIDSILVKIGYENYLIFSVILHH